MDAYAKVREALRTCDDQTILVLHHLFLNDDILPKLLQALGCRIDASHNTCSAPSMDAPPIAAHPEGALGIQWSDSGPTDDASLASPSVAAPSATGLPTMPRPEHRSAPPLLECPVVPSEYPKSPPGGLPMMRGGLRPMMSSENLECLMWSRHAADDPFQDGFQNPPKRIKHSFSLADISRCSDGWTPAREVSPENRSGTRRPPSLTNRPLQRGSTAEDQEEAARVRSLLTAHLRRVPNHTSQDVLPHKQRSYASAQHQILALQSNRKLALSNKAQRGQWPLETSFKQQALGVGLKRSWGLPEKTEQARSMFDVLFPEHNSQVNLIS